MARNEPVMNSGDDRDDDRGKKDPWSSPDQGPPDLDEALNKMRDQLRGIFGGKGRGQGSGGSGRPAGPQMSFGLVGLGLLVLLVLWGFAGVYQVDEKERTVILRLGKYHSTVGPGLHWNPLLI
ncbi:MAG: protease modulator HflK N-terminal domain-containing protein, partial [Gammaproteobacteria bacterium]|nr:protease modulator HflK N-terminal domain-containing protein [Gammaproteobacteria bacterium]